jgi:hypothetical protein
MRLTVFLSAGLALLLIVATATKLMRDVGE